MENNKSLSNILSKGFCYRFVTEKECYNLQQKRRKQDDSQNICTAIELPTTKVAGFSGRSQLRYLLAANETLIQRPEVAKNYRAIPVIPTVR